MGGGGRDANGASGWIVAEKGQQAEPVDEISGNLLSFPVHF